MIRLFVIAVFSLTTYLIHAQQLSLFTQYRENLTIINPGAVDGDFLAFGNNLNFGASIRAQWVGLSNAPNTQTLRFSYINAYGSGVALMGGGHIINDQTGPTGFTGFYGRIAGIVTDDPEYGGFVIGLSAGAVQYRVRSSKIYLRDPNDLLGTTDQTQFFPDVGVGLFYYQTVGDGDYLYLGASVPQVIGLDLTFQNDEGEYFVKRVQHIYGQAGWYKFFGNDSFLEPSVWVKYAPNAPINVDFNLRYQLPSTLWVGAGGSSGGMAHLEAGLVLGENIGLDNLIKIGYGFDYSFRSFGPTTGTTHEINVGLSFYK